MKAIEANKHVMFEKPIALSAAEAIKLENAAKQKPHLKVMEACMYRFNPQWQKAKVLIADGKISTFKTVQSFFSYLQVVFILSFYT